MRTAGVRTILAFRIHVVISLIDFSLLLGANPRLDAGFSSHNASNCWSLMRAVIVCVLDVATVLWWYVSIFSPRSEKIFDADGRSSTTSISPRPLAVLQVPAWAAAGACDRHMSKERAPLASDPARVLGGCSVGLPWLVTSCLRVDSP